MNVLEYEYEYQTMLRVQVHIHVGVQPLVNVLEYEYKYFQMYLGTSDTYVEYKQALLICQQFNKTFHYKGLRTPIVIQ